MSFSKFIEQKSFLNCWLKCYLVKCKCWYFILINAKIWLSYNGCMLVMTEIENFSSSYFVYLVHVLWHASLREKMLVHRCRSTPNQSVVTLFFVYLFCCCWYSISCIDMHKYSLLAHSVWHYLQANSRCTRFRFLRCNIRFYGIMRDYVSFKLCYGSGLYIVIYKWYLHVLIFNNYGHKWEYILFLDKNSKWSIKYHLVY